jgi:hypothetical protein
LNSSRVYNQKITEPPPPLKKPPPHLQGAASYIGILKTLGDQNGLKYESKEQYLYPLLTENTGIFNRIVSLYLSYIISWDISFEGQCARGGNVVATAQ